MPTRSVKWGYMALPPKTVNPRRMQLIEEENLPTFPNDLEKEQRTPTSETSRGRPPIGRGQLSRGSPQWARDRSSGR